MMEANVQSQTGPELAKQVIYTLNIQPLSHFGDQRGSKSKTRNRFLMRENKLMVTRVEVGGGMGKIGDGD